MNLLILKPEEKNRVKDVIEVMTEIKAMIQLLKSFVPWFPSGLHPYISFPDYVVRKNKTEEKQNK